jgi:hypothetical protein
VCERQRERKREIERCFIEHESKGDN